MRKTLLFSILSILFFTCVFAQKQNVYFLKNDGKRVSTKDSADYVRIVSEPDSGTVLYNVKEFYANGKPKLVGKSSKIEYNVLEGQCVSFFPSGKRKQFAGYKQGDLVGDAYNYYHNGVLYTDFEYSQIPAEGGNSVGKAFGSHYLIKICNDSLGKPIVTNGNGHYINYSNDFKTIIEEGDVKNGESDGQWTGIVIEQDSLRFKDTYVNGKLIAGVSIDKKGGTYSYTQKEVNPQFAGGETAFAHFLMKNVRYPDQAKENNIQGKLYITFVVERDGSLTEAKAVRSPSKDLADEGLRVINLSPKWVPGYLHGKPVRVQYTVPLNFSLGDAPRSH